jgi:hyperosmotically inducible periplasmic protein
VYEPARFGIRERLLASMLAALSVISIVSSCAHRPIPIDEDLALARRVQSRLEVDRELRAFGITAAATEGTVVLRGRVEDELDRRRADMLTREVPGVERVVDAMVVVTPPHDQGSPFRDAWVATRVKARLVASPQLDASRVTVEADQGIVVLSGRVASDRDRRAAETLTRQTRGVVEVSNRIEVSPGTHLDPA